MAETILHLADVPLVESLSAASTYVESFRIPPREGGPRPIDWAGHVPSTDEPQPVEYVDEYSAYVADLLRRAEEHQAYLAELIPELRQALEDARRD